MSLPFADAPFRDPTRPVSERVADLLGRMTLDEKLAQIAGRWISELVSTERVDPGRVADQLRHGAGHITRIGASTGLGPQASARLMNEVQRAVVERTRLGIPVVVHEESVAGYCGRGATVFPQAIGLASTWDTDLLSRAATAIRLELLAVGARHTLAPVLDVARDPRWGRVEETYGESPYLCGRLGTVYVQAVQTDDLAGGVICTGKHFLGYALGQGGLNHAPIHVGPRELREVYAEPFAAVIRDAGLASMMNSYSSIDGEAPAASAAILTTLLRDELGFDGVVVADYGAVGLLISHHRVAGGRQEAAVRSLRAGLDVELPALNCYGAPLKAAVEGGEVEEALVDRAVERVLRSKFDLGLFENPYVDASLADGVLGCQAHRDLARETVAASIVVLTNDGVLPLDPMSGSLRRVAVVGPTADDQRLLQGDYHYPSHLELIYEREGPAAELGMEVDVAPAAEDGIDYVPEGGGTFRPGPFFTPHVTPLAGLRAALEPGGVEVVHEVGCAVTGEDGSGLASAVAAAASADIAVVCVGGRSGLRPACTSGEFIDVVSLDLTGLQRRLVAEVAATGTPVVLVLIGGRVNTIAAEADVAAAVVQAWVPGEQGGAGLADVLTGAVNPSGRLPVTMPRSVGQVPIHHDHRAGGSKTMFLDTYIDSPTTPLFAFGHGLSYTTFSYGPLVADGSSDELTTADVVSLTVEVTNTGSRGGHEVVQLYVTDEVASVARPTLSLIGFTRPYVAAGATVSVTFVVHPSRLAFFDESMRFVVEPGVFTFAVGGASDALASSAHIVLAGSTVEHRQRDVVATAASCSGG